MERITHKRTISQGEKHLDPRRGKSFTGTLSEIHDTAYAAVAQPQKVVVLPRYFITHWLPILGPSLAWLVLAFRQAAFVAQCDRPEAARALSVRKLSHWAGLSHGQIWNLVQKSAWLPWFVRRISRSSQRQESDVWGVRTSIPLAPHHILLLEEAIEAHRSASPGLDALSLTQALTAVAAQVRRTAAQPGTGLEPAQAQTLHELLEDQFGPLDIKTTQLADEITARIIQPGNTIAISHYFIHRWRSQMTSGEAWLVHLLRTQVYSQNQAASLLAISGGKAQLARSLGVNTRSVRRWFSGLPGKALHHFLQPQPAENSEQVLAIEISMRDPVHEADLPAFEQHLAELRTDKIGQRGGQNWTEGARTPPGLPDKIGQASGQDWTEGRTEIDTPPDKNEQGAGQNWTAPRTKVDTLIVFNPDPNPNNPIQPPQPPEKHLEQVGGGWDIDKILQMGGLSPQKRSGLLSSMQADARLAISFLAWLLYGYESKSRPGARIVSPVLFAVSRFQHSRPAPVYLSLAGKSPARLIKDMQNRFLPDVRPDLQTTLGALEAGGLAEVLLALEPELPDQGGASLSLPGPDAAGTPVPEETAARYETLQSFVSAEDVWECVRSEAGLAPDIAPVSLWLNDARLELSFMQEAQAASVQLALESSREQLAHHFPGFSFQLRTLEMRQRDFDAFPVVGIKSEAVVAL